MIKLITLMTVSAEAVQVAIAVEKMVQVAVLVAQETEAAEAADQPFGLE